jgi:hypothetical protein
MTISTENRKSGPYTCNGVTTVFPFDFKVFQTSDVYVVLTLASTGGETVLALTTNYTVTLNANQNTSPGGTITTTTTYSSDFKITITSDIANLQSTDLTNQGGFYPSVITNAFDKATIQIQQLAEQVTRSLKIPLSSTASANLPAPSAYKAFAWNSTATALEERDLTISYSASVEVATFALLGSTAATLNQVVTIRGHTTAGIGGGQFIAKAGSVAAVTGIRINSATAGLYFERMVLHDIYDAWMTGATGVKAADEAAILICINEIKANNRGTLIIPSKISATAVVPPPALGNSQSIDIIDLRMDRTGGIQAFGVEEHWMEGKDSGGGYASEFRIKGKQNPGYSMYPLSDGTAAGYSYANNMTSIVSFNNAGQNNVQYLSDPFSKGYKGDWAFEQYSAGASTVSLCFYAGVDLNNKTRFDFTPIQLASTAINIASITNTTPIVINTSTPHGMVAQYGPVGILATTISALNGSSWIAQNTGASQLTLINSVASGAQAAPAGTIGVQKNAQRATINVPAIQGGTEAIVAEGKMVATGTNGQFVSEVATGTPPLNVTSTTPVVNLNSNCTSYNAAGTQQVNCHEVHGFVSLVAGTATVTLTGSAAFTLDSTFNTSAVDHTANASVQVIHNSGSSVTFNGTGTHLIGYSMFGN